MLYIGETGRRFEMTQKDSKRDLKQLEEVKYTRSRRMESLMDIHQSALTDHGMSKNSHDHLGGCEPPSKRTRLEEKRHERSHRPQEGRDTH